VRHLSQRQAGLPSLAGPEGGEEPCTSARDAPNAVVRSHAWAISAMADRRLPGDVPAGGGAGGSGARGADDAGREELDAAGAAAPDSSQSLDLGGWGLGLGFRV
jgi:hypothetical protein